MPSLYIVSAEALGGLARLCDPRVESILLPCILVCDQGEKLSRKQLIYVQTSPDMF